MVGLNDLYVLLSFSEHKTLPAANGQVSISFSILIHFTCIYHMLDNQGEKVQVEVQNNFVCVCLLN